MSDLGKAYVQIVPSADGISGNITKVLDGEATSAGKSAGAKIATGIGTGLKLAGAAAIASTAAVGVFAKSSVDAGMSFDSAMSQVAATMGTTTDQIGNLRDFALEMGSTTQFSATQAADALNYMALAGYKDYEAMDMLPTVLDLAAAGSMDLASASDMVTDAQSALALSFDETKTMVDQMAKTASTTNTSVEQLGNGILKIGATARGVKGGTAELSQVLGILADNGIKGAEGGTHLRNAILSLQTPTDKGIEALEKLGMTYDDMYDSVGNMRSLPEIFQQLSTSMEGMTQQSKDAIISGIFNKTDLAAVNALIGTTSERWDEVGNAIANANGAAKTMARTLLENLAGDITIFNSAMEGLKIAVSDAMTGSLREIVQFGSESVSALTDAFREGGIEGAATELGSIISKGLSAIVKELPQFTQIGMQLLTALGQGLMDNLPVIITAATSIIQQIVQGIVTALPQLVEGAQQILAGLANGIAESLPTLIPTIVEVIAEIVQVLIDNVPMLLEAGVALLTGLADGLLAALPVLIAKLPELIQSIVNAFVTGLPILIQGAIQLVTGLVQALPEIITALVDALPQIIEAVVQGIITCLPILIDGHIQLITALAAALPEICQALFDAIPQIVTTIANAIVENAPQLLMAILMVNQQITETVMTFGSTLLTTVGTNLMSLLETVTTYLSQLPSRAAQFAGQMVGQFISFIIQLPGKITETFNNVMTAVKNFGQKFIAEGPKMANDFKNKLIEIMKSIPSKMIEIGHDIVEGLKNGISSAWGGLKEWLNGLIGDFIEGIKAGLKIGSPSKVMADEIGKWIPAGIAMGIEENQGIIEQAMSGMSMNIAPYDSTGAAIGSLNKAVADGKNVTVVVQLEGDADRLFRVMQAKSTANYRLTGNKTMVTA